ncbi:hypothetical protein SORBI_3001G139850 [Sorghum bicolor]|uniref:Uncharacterized protein n=1 Tax=Sorghum bicolor TaxID=4558 RepID=A0A1Z5S5L8_SORBI|nr:hypothetical protein SORBI_3001G139850 [Sorghum bicolor]
MAAEAAEAPSPMPPRTGEAKAPATPGKRAPADRDEKERRRDAPRASEVAATAVAAASREDESVDSCNGVEPSFSFHARSCSSA